jgi:hypothetical protein
MNYQSYKRDGMNEADVITQEQEVVLAQLGAASPELHFFVGTSEGTKSYTKKELIKHVGQLDEVGCEFIKTQMEFLRSFQNGEIADILASAVEL